MPRLNVPVDLDDFSKSLEFLVDSRTEIAPWTAKKQRENY
jgi:hypothetical protein